MKLKLFYGFLIIILLISCGANAEDMKRKFEKANTLYQKKQYKEAAGTYEAIRKEGYSSYQLFFNLGNALYRQNDVPAAILNYERAKRLAPSDEDVQYNLQLANLKITDKI